jgi:biopolymer transport protein TolR
MAYTFRFRPSGLVAEPLMTVGLPVDLPRTNATPLPQEQEPLTISLDSRGRIFLQETEVEMNALVPQLRAIMRNHPPGQPERRIFIRGDRTISYGRVMELMGTVSAAGFSRVVLLAEQPQGRVAVAEPRPRAGGANPSPEYPPASRLRGEQGRVTLLVQVDMAGRVAGVSVLNSSGFPALDRAAEAAVRRWEFDPATQEGRPVFSTTTVGINFRLDQDASATRR